MNYRYIFSFHSTVIGKIETVHRLTDKEILAVKSVIGSHYVNDLSYIDYSVVSLNGAQVVKVNG